LIDVPAESMNDVGCRSNWSVSLAAIHWKRVDRTSVLAIRPAWARCQRNTESAVAQPTQEPVAPWSPIFHQVSSRRSFADGTSAVASTPASSALWYFQSLSGSGEGTQLRIRRVSSSLLVDLVAGVAAVRRRLPFLAITPRRVHGDQDRSLGSKVGGSD
jgi:hypothetical protein